MMGLLGRSVCSPSFSCAQDGVIPRVFLSFFSLFFFAVFSLTPLSAMGSLDVART